MTRSGNRDRKTHQTYWSDLEPWIEQLYGEHGYQTSFEVYLHADRVSMKPAVVMQLSKPARERGQPCLYRDWRVFDPEAIGGCEAAALFLISRALLSLDNEKALAEAKQTSLWDK